MLYPRNLAIALKLFTLLEKFIKWKPCKIAGKNHYSNKLWGESNKRQRETETEEKN